MTWRDQEPFIYDGSRCRWSVKKIDGRSWGLHQPTNQRFPAEDAERQRPTTKPASLIYNLLIQQRRQPLTTVIIYPQTDWNANITHSVFLSHSSFRFFCANTFFIRLFFITPNTHVMRQWYYSGATVVLQCARRIPSSTDKVFIPLLLAISRLRFRKLLLRKSALV